MQVSGECLCGSVQYKAKLKSNKGYYCHCRMCQMAFGNTRAAFVNAKASDVKWLKKKPKFYKSSKFARRGFCGTCGTPLTFAYVDSENMDISVGSLKHPEKLKPTSHFAWESRVKTWEKPDSLNKISLKSYQALLEKWKKHYGNKEPGLSTARRGKKS